MSTYALGQIVGSVALVLSMTVYQINNRRKMLLISTAAALLWAIGFMLIHAYTGAAMNFLSVFRCYTFSRTTTNKQSMRVLACFGALAIVATAFTWAGPVSLLALAANLCNATAESQLHTKRLRRFALLAPPLWFAYNFMTAFYPGMAVEVLITLSNLVGQYRFDMKRNSRKRRQASNNLLAKWLGFAA